jgi:DNA-binding MurR/RpiR family transcriptional regulator
MLLSNPLESAYFGVREVAQQADVHATSVVRVAQKLGYKGYQELRQKLREDLNENTTAERIKKRLTVMGENSILSALITSEIQALQAIPDQISQKQIDQAVSLICRAKQILVFGIGHPSALADLFTRRLNRSGYNARSFHHIDWETPELMMTFSKGDVLFSIITQTIPKGLKCLMVQVEAIGAANIVVGDVVGNFLRPRPNVLLAASRGKEGASQSLTVPMAICNTLILEISKQDDGRSMDSLRRLTQARQVFTQNSKTGSRKSPSI